MRDIAELPGLQKEGVVLLCGAGMETVEKFIASDAVDIVERLEEVGKNFEEGIRPPSQSLVEAWQMSGRELLEKDVRASGREASEVSAEDVQKAGIQISSLPVARIFELESTVEPTAEPQRPKEWGQKSDGELGVGDRDYTVRQKPREAFRSLSGAQKAEPKIGHRSRGKPHPNARFVRWAALLTVATTLLGMLLLVGVIVVAVMAFGFGFRPAPGMAVALLLFPGALIFYLLMGIRARCQYCGERCFVSKNCQKHERAVRSILGFGFAAARDVLLFSSFRCMYCGSKIRLKD